MARISGVDLPREKRVEIGLTYIYGIGRTTASKICAETNINPDTRVKDLTEEEVDTIRKYIRFENGDILLGEEGNELTLRIENDSISFLDGGAEVAYLSNKKLYVLDGHFLNSLRIGKFAFLPRENGNLSLVKVGE